MKENVKLVSYMVIMGTGLFFILVNKIDQYISSQYQLVDRIFTILQFGVLLMFIYFAWVFLRRLLGEVFREPGRPES